MKAKLQPLLFLAFVLDTGLLVPNEISASDIKPKDQLEKDFDYFFGMHASLDIRGMKGDMWEGGS